MRRTLLALTMAACTGLVACETEGVLEPNGAVAGSVVPAGGAGELTVMTRNIYLGFDIDGVIVAGSVSTEAMMMALVQGWQDLHGTDFNERAEALADEIAAARPHLVGTIALIERPLGQHCGSMWSIRRHYRPRMTARVAPTSMPGHFGAHMPPQSTSCVS